MKREPFFITRWWRGLTLQMRLFLAFTLLVAFSVLSLSLFLNNVIQMIRINRETQAIFEQNREIYRFKASISQYQLALKSYENSETERSYELAEQALTTYGKRVADNFSSLDDQMEFDQTQIDQFTNSKSEIDRVTDQVKQAVQRASSLPEGTEADAEWNKVQALDKQANAAFATMYEIADGFQAQGQADLAAATAKAEQISWVTLVAALVVFPAFLLLAVLAALVIYRQINQPLRQLTEAAQAVQAGSFQAQSLDHLAEREDELGALTRLFTRMAGSINQRSDVLRQEADTIREKIR